MKMKSKTVYRILAVLFTTLLLGRIGAVDLYGASLVPIFALTTLSVVFIRLATSNR